MEIESGLTINVISKIAILANQDNFDYKLQAFQDACRKHNIEVAVFDTNAPILIFKPDFVIVTTPQHAKLTPYPTYGLIDKPKDEYLELPRFLRNILTYDGYLVTSPRLQQMLQDAMFGTRKLNTKLLNFDFYPEVQEAVDSHQQNQILIFEPDFANSKYKKAIYTLLDNFSTAKVLTFSVPASNKYLDRTIKLAHVRDLPEHLQQAKLAICLETGDNQEQLIYPTIMYLLASGTITIAQHTTQLENYFGENIFYIPTATKLNSLAQVVQQQIDRINSHYVTAKGNSQKAQQIFVDNFSFDALIDKLFYFHKHNLINKGYCKNPDPKFEAALPSVTYIMRTGGKHRYFLERALNCLVAQNYPDLRVIFVIHAEFAYLNEIIEKYKSLKIKVITSIKSRRSEAIRDGMAAVETDLFGLFDDDDELFPNHVRSLVNTLQYHSNRDWRGEIGMVYSGSIHADDTYVVEERVEYRDHKLVQRFEKRAIEHFKFYSGSLMAQHAWFMPNGWLARRSLIDTELLTDPQLDTCEDLYFELQIAQKSHFAFSMEVTAIHNFHHLGNSTIDDSHKHLPDTQRIALRNLGRVFPPDALYDTHYSLIGRASNHDPNQVAYQDSIKRPLRNLNYYDTHPFYPFRNKKGIKYHTTPKFDFSKLKISQIPQLPIKFIIYTVRFLCLNRAKRDKYIKKFLVRAKEHGLMSAIFLTIYKLQCKPYLEKSMPEVAVTEGATSMSYYKFKILVKYHGWRKAIKLLFKR